MEDGAHLGLVARLDVGRGAHNDLRDGQAADEAAEGVAHALGDELAVGGGDALVGIELVGGLHAKQRLEAGHNGDGDAQGPHCAVADGTEVREAENAAKCGVVSFANDGELNQLIHRKTAAQGWRGGCPTPMQHRHQRAGQDRGQCELLHEGTLPQDEGGQTEDRNHQRCGRDVVQHHGELTEGVLTVRLLE